MASLTTGELAKRGGVNLESIRFFERQGLLPRPPRTHSGYRQFSEDSVRRVRFIKRAQELGFSLREIGELLDLRSHPESACPDVRSHADAKVVDIDRKVRELRAIRTELVRLSKAWGGRTQAHCCPILQRLETNGDLNHVRRHAE